MNWLDLVIIAVIAIATFSGWRMGIVKAASTLAGMVSGVYLASVYHSQAADALGTVTENETLATFLGYTLIFVIAIAAAFVAGSVLRKMLRLALLGWVDTFAGAAAGFLVAIGILMAILIPLRNTERLSLGETIHNAGLASLIADTAPQVEALLPGGFDDLTDFLSRQLPKGP